MKKLTKRPVMDNTVEAYACVCTTCRCTGCGCGCSDNNGVRNDAAARTYQLAYAYDKYDDSSETAYHK